MNNIVITGASSGIGRSLAFEFARRGYNLGLTARRIDLLEGLKQEILGQNQNLRVENRMLDVTDYDQVFSTIPELVSSLGGTLSIFIANAGIAGTKNTSVSGFQINKKIIDVNLIGAMACFSSAADIMKKQKSGQIVGISSVAGFRGLPGSAAYSSSKAGLTVYMEAMRSELKKFNITVTTIQPGFIDTPINQDKKSRPFVVNPSRGGTLIANLIEKKVSVSTVPRFPWGIIGFIMRNIPDFIWQRLSSI
ncbi:MAG: SDR family NAD(P)-dependent oxidoreductase [Leptospira sp.]|nr:SDR family NAD(P)-dependent oxidoreductase [Leptospira sp.]